MAPTPAQTAAFALAAPSTAAAAPNPEAADRLAEVLDLLQ